METLTEVIIAAGWADRVLNESQLARRLGGSAQRRYNLVNRALHRGELVRLRRGRYRLSASVSGKLPHAFVIAQALRSGSYVSFETALSFHGWIPEAVPVTWSAIPGGRAIETTVPEIGEFRFSPLALERGYFLEGVDRMLFDGHAALVAQPLRALLDLFCLRKWDWPAVKALTGLRIDPDARSELQPQSFETLRPVYRHRRMGRFIDALLLEWTA